MTFSTNRKSRVLRVPAATTAARPPPALHRSRRREGLPTAFKYTDKGIFGFPNRLYRC